MPIIADNPWGRALTTEHPIVALYYRELAEAYLSALVTPEDTLRDAGLEGR